MMDDRERAECRKATLLATAKKFSEKARSLGHTMEDIHEAQECLYAANSLRKMAEEAE